MPARNSVKQYVEGGYYHVYNRGVERRTIFLDDQDYSCFLHLLNFYLSPDQETNEHPLRDFGFEPVRVRPLKNLHGEVELLCFCLMPTHFHLLIKQINSDGMTKLMRRVLTTYSMYFNRRYNRIGTLFAGSYKAVLVDNDFYLLHLTRYIHTNPSLTKTHLNQYPYSSYRYYLGEKTAGWVHPEFILSFFAGEANPLRAGFGSYKQFLEGYLEEPEQVIGKLSIEKD